MNKEQVTQDKDSSMDKNYKSIVYAIDIDGNYIKVPSVGWEPENFALKQAWDSINENIEQAKKQVISGEISPIGYYMEKNQYTVKRLAHLAGFPKRKIRKHLNPKNFAKLNQKTFETYTTVFQITIEQFFKPF